MVTADLLAVKQELTNRGRIPLTAACAGASTPRGLTIPEFPRGVRDLCTTNPTRPRWEDAGLTLLQLQAMLDAAIAKLG